MIIPSMTLWGLPSSRRRSMKEPGSPSSALQEAVEGHALFPLPALAARRVAVEQPLHRAAAVGDTGHDLFGVARRHLVVKRSFRPGEHQRALLAEAVAAGALELDASLQPGALQ